PRCLQVPLRPAVACRMPYATLFRSEDLRIAELLTRIDEEGVTELVIATNPTMSGEATALHLADLVRGRVRVTRLASGLPVGADLEHADELTLGRALLGRRPL